MEGLDPAILNSLMWTTWMSKLLFAFMSVAMLMGTLKLFDWMNGTHFRDIAEELGESKGTATAIYYGARIIAVAGLIGNALG